MTKNTKRKKAHYQTWVEVDLRAVRYNIQLLKKIAGKYTQLLAVVKANAYGHGMIEVAKTLEKQKVDYFAVSTVEEGMVLRQAGCTTPVLIFGFIPKSSIKDVFRFRLTPTVFSLSFAKALNRYAQKTKKETPIHVKIDTGMGRLGIWQEEALSFIRELSKLTYLRFEGIYTHFPVADTDARFTKTQIGNFSLLIKQLMHEGLIFLYTHAANSMGLIQYPNRLFNLARPGLMLYGLYPKSEVKSKIRLKPVLSVKTKVIFLKEISKGRSVSYGRTFIARNKKKIATLPIGYKDGYIRLLSNNAVVLIDGQRCPVVGRVTMDYIMVDVTHVRGVKEGTEAVILGRQKKSVITAEELAKKAKTINYEIVCSLGSHLPHIYRR